MFLITEITKHYKARMRRHLKKHKPTVNIHVSSSISYATKIAMYTYNCVDNAIAGNVPKPE